MGCWRTRSATYGIEIWRGRWARDAWGAAGPTAEEEQGRQGRLVARSARAHLVRLRGDHASHGYYPQNDALANGGVRRRRLRQVYRRGSRSRVGAGEARGVPRDGETRREDARPRVERLRGVVHR